MERWHVVGVVIALVLIGLALESVRARAHSVYEAECCHDRDCYPVEDGAVIEEADGWRIRAGGQFVGRGSDKVRFSPDGRYHVCTYGGDPKAGVICLYVPGRGA